MNASVDAPEIQTATSDAPARAARWPWVLALLVLIAAGIALVAGLRSVRQAEVDAGRDAARNDALDARLAALERGLEQVRQSQQSLVQRLESNAATNQVLREELLGMGERAGLLEDAVARLSQTRASGETVLRLNEAEFLLSMGAERLNLYADVPSAIQAFQLAEGALAGLDDPALATLRQTLAQELIVLKDVPPDPRSGLRAELGALSSRLTALPPSQEDVLPLGAKDGSRLSQLLGQLVTVRRVDPKDTVLGPSQRQAALASVALQLELAQAALARPDQAGYEAALAQIRATSRPLFAEQDAAVQDWFAQLDRLQQATLVPQLPVLGATLRELRSLREARRVPAAPLHLPVPDVAPAAPAPTDAGDASEPTTSVAPAMESLPQVERAASPEVSPEPAEAERKDVLPPPVAPDAPDVVGDDGVDA